MRWMTRIGSCQPLCGLRTDQSQSVGCVAKRIITIIDVRLEMWNQQAEVLQLQAIVQGGIYHKLFLFTVFKIFLQVIIDILQVL